MTLFRNQTHQEVWIQRWCDTCFQPDQARHRLTNGLTGICPILERALRTERKPPQWDRTRSTDMETSIKCNVYMSKPPIVRRGTAESEDVPMFDIEPHEAHLVPVEGWPERPRKNGVDHA